MKKITIEIPDDEYEQVVSKLRLYSSSSRFQVEDDIQHSISPTPDKKHSLLDHKSVNIGMILKPYPSKDDDILGEMIGDKDDNRS